MNENYKDGKLKQRKLEKRITSVLRYYRYVGFIKGTKYPDEMILIGNHYGMSVVF